MKRLKINAARLLDAADAVLAGPISSGAGCCLLLEGKLPVPPAKRPGVPGSKFEVGELAGCSAFVMFHGGCLL